MKKQNNIKICKDGFVWRVLEKWVATDLWMLNVIELYVLHDDDSESLITGSVGEGCAMIRDAFNNGEQVGIEVGYISPIEALNLVEKEVIEAHRVSCFLHQNERCCYQESVRKCDGVCTPLKRFQLNLKSLKQAWKKRQ